MDKTAYLVLANGKTFKGKRFGADGDVIAEVVFTTSMSGYVEAITDKGFYGQAIVQTFPLIGNYGVISSDEQGDEAYVSAYIVKDVCRDPSNFRCEGTLDEYLKAKGVVGLYGIDTRSLTRIIRDNGSMNGMITSDLGKVDYDEIRAHKVKDSIKAVSTKTPYVINGEGKYKVALMDYGVKNGLVECLTDRGCDVYVYPYDTEPSVIAEFDPDGIVLSNGPGAPDDVPECIENIKGLMSLSKPMCGVCIGHQLMALANGFKSEKMSFGHHGENQPVRNTETGRVYITAQGHGYSIVSDSIDESIATELYINVNDATCEGIKYKNLPATTVQFHPEASGGPKDTLFIFDEFIKSMEDRICR